MFIVFTVMLFQSIRVFAVSVYKNTVKMFCILYLINVEAKCFARIYILYIKKLHEVLKLENIYYKINKLNRNCKELWVYFAVETNTACFKEPLKNI